MLWATGACGSSEPAPLRALGGASADHGRRLASELMRDIDPCGPQGSSVSSALQSDRRADDAIGIIDRRDNQIDR